MPRVNSSTSTVSQAPVVSSEPAIPVSTPVSTTVSPAVRVAEQQQQDEFLAGSSGVAMPQPAEIAAKAERAVRGFQLELEQKKKARETANAIVSCITPLLSSKGPLEDQIYLLLLRIMGKVQADRRDGDLDQANLERLQKAIKAEHEKFGAEHKALLDGVIADVEKAQEALKSTQKSISDEESRAMESLSSLLKAQHEANMGIVRA